MNKTAVFNGGGYSEYSAPKVTALDVVVEKGFAQSLFSDHNTSWGDDVDFYE